MKKIDQYILGKFLTTFFFCIILFTVIIVVVDISEKTDDFVKANLSAWQIFSQYYIGFIPRIDAMLFPLFVFLSVIYFTSKMAGRSEIIAILSSGTSFRRMLVPYMAGAFILAGILWMGYQYVVPKANMKYGDFSKTYIDVNRGMLNTNKSYIQNLYFKVDKNAYVGIRGYDTVTKTGNGFFYQKFDDSSKLLYNLRASTFNWDTASLKWRLSNAVERKIFPISEQVSHARQLLMNYNFKPIDLRKDEYLKDQMPTRQLDAYIENERLRGSEGLNDLLVERYNRDAIPVSVIILTVIGMALASRKVRGGSGAHIAIGVLLSVTYILFSRFSVVFATKGSFSPLLAAWTPNLVFGLLAFYIYKTAPK